MIDVRMSFWRTPARIAWRDLCASRGQALFLLVAMALSIAGAGGVHSAARIARRMLEGDSRAWLTGDVSVDTGEPVGDDHVAALEAWKRPGSDWTLVTWTMTMAASDQAPDAAYISVKAVEPAKYPFHGRLVTQPPQALQEMLQAETVLVSEGVLERLHVRAGDSLQIGGTPFRIAGSYRTEPERYLGVYSFGLRCILSQEGLARSGILRGGNEVRNRVVLRLAPSADLAEARQWLQRLVPEGQVTDHLDAYSQEVSRFETVTTGVNMIAFLALVLGSGGVAIAARSHLENSIAKLAILKVLGGRSAQIAASFSLQLGCVMAGALLLGIPLGASICAVLLWMAQRLVYLPGEPVFDVDAIAGSVALSFLALLPVLIQPVILSRRLRPAALLRGEDALAGRDGLAARSISAACYFAVLAFVAVRMFASWKTALSLSLALALGVLLASGGAVLSLAALRALLRRFAGSLAPVWRHGSMNLLRPGNRSLTMLVTLAMGFMLILGSLLSAEAIVHSVTRTMPYGDADLVVVGFEEQHRERVQQVLRSQAGVEGVEMQSQARLRLSAVNGAPVSGSSNWYLVYCASQGHASQVPAATVSAEMAAKLGIGVGSRLGFETRAGQREAVVERLRALSPGDRFWFTLSVDCGAFQGISVVHQAVVRIRPGSVAAVRDAVRQQFPSLAVIATEEIAQTLRDATARATFLLRLIAWYAAGSGLMILIAIVSASRRIRFREMALLSALGASRRTLGIIYTLEFCTIGLLAGLLGSLAAAGLAAVMLWQVFHRLALPADAAALALAMPAAVAIVVVAGWLPTYSLLRRKPIEILRSE